MVVVEGEEGKGGEEGTGGGGVKRERVGGWGVAHAPSRRCHIWDETDEHH